MILCFHCRSVKPPSNQETKNVKTKENYLANEAEKAIEYNKVHKKKGDRAKEKARLEEQRQLNELNHKKHEPAQHKKKDEGQFKMY